MDHDDIPYYHTNIHEVNQELHELSVRLVNKHGQPADDTATDWDGDTFPVKLTQITWENPELQTAYKLGKFTGDDEIKYGNHYMLTIVETIGDEKEITVHIFSTKIEDNGRTTYDRQQDVRQRTAENQRKEDEWWEANKYLSPNGSGIWLAMRPDTTDDIAYQGELLLHTLQQAEKLIVEGE